MFYRYELVVFLDSKIIFDGCFSSINKMVKVAANFDSSCLLEASDIAFNKEIPIESLVEEFSSPVI